MPSTWTDRERERERERERDSLGSNVSGHQGLIP